MGWVVAGVSARGDEHLRYNLKDECQVDSVWQVATGTHEMAQYQIWLMIDLIRFLSLRYIITWVSKQKRVSITLSPADVLSGACCSVRLPWGGESTGQASGDQS